MAIEVFYSKEPEAPLETPEQVDRLFDRLRETTRTGHGIIADVITAGSETSGPAMEVGIKGDVGFVTWVPRVPGQPGASTVPDDMEAGEFVYYFKGTSASEIPVDGQVPIEIVKRAVKEFLASGGAVPSSPPWRD